MTPPTATPSPSPGPGGTPLFVYDVERVAENAPRIHRAMSMTHWLRPFAGALFLDRTPVR